jgi:hypothetical protein
MLTTCHLPSPSTHPRSLIDILVSKGSFWLLGLTPGLSPFVEVKRRRGELDVHTSEGVRERVDHGTWEGMSIRDGELGEGLVGVFSFAPLEADYEAGP